MEIPISEIIDRISILRLKIENGSNPSFKEELSVYEKALEQFRKRGIRIKSEWLEELYMINKYQWGLESSLREMRENKSELKELGKLYIQIQISNKKRMAVKNQITEETGSGFKDIKVN